MTANSKRPTFLTRVKRRIRDTLGLARSRTVKKVQDQLRRRDREVSRISNAAKRAINDATTHMWGGYAEVGAQNLLSLAQTPYILPHIRAVACYELARFYADSGRHYLAAHMMSDARALSRNYMRGIRQRVLEFEMLLATDDTTLALHRIEDYITYRPDDPNYHIGLANYHHKMGDLDQQIAVINGFYARHNMATIRVSEQNEPFLSLVSADTPAPVTDGPKVSVFISSYNAADYLRLAVSCMQQQTWQNLEIIITDDCSTDNSRALLREMAAEDPRLVIVENTENYGTYGNRNRMLEICTGDYLTVHDSDDWSHPQMIEHQMRHLMDNPDVRLNTTLMCRVSRDLKFHLRPSRASLEYCHKNYPGFLMKTADVKALGGWDPIMANADAEFERRFKETYGAKALAVINPNITYSFFLVHNNSLTQQKLMNLRSLAFGSRNEYQRQSEFWLQQQTDAGQDTTPTDPPIVTKRPSRQEPFPSPNGLLPPYLKKDTLEYDVLLVSDLFLLGGTRSCNVNYIKILNAMGKRVAVFNWPRGDLRYTTDIHADYRQLAQDGLIEIVTWEDTIKVKEVIIHHPPLASMELDNYPTITTDRVSVLINQLPFQTTERTTDFYQPAQITRRLQRVFNTETVTWIAISPLTHEYISAFRDEINISDQIWYPPIFTEGEHVTIAPQDRFERLQRNGPQFARHCRDHWTKWPKSATRTTKMYMADSGHRFSILGGGERTLRRQMPAGIPDNWQINAFDSITVSEFLNDADIYLNFNNEIYIEEFGRNVMEAMLYGVPVITDEVFAKTFEDAVLIAGPEGSAAVADRLCSDQAFFMEQVARGTAFVEAHCATDSVRQKLEAYFS